MNYIPFEEAVEICDYLRKPINSKTRDKRIEGKTVDELFPYYGATGQVGFIDEYLSDGEYVLLGEDGAPFLNAFAPKAYLINGKAWVNNHAHVLRSKTNNKFLCYFLNQVNYKDYVSGTTRLKLTQAEMKRIMVPNPTPTEQTRIVSRIEELFSELDAGVETLRKTQRQLETYRQAVLKEAFENIDGTEGILEYFIINKPRNGYSPKPVAYKTKYKNLTLTSTTGGVFKENNFKYIDIDITDDSYLWVKHNDILIQRANTIDYVGTAALYTGKDNVYVYPDLMMKCHPIASVLPQFLVYQMHYQQIRGYYRDNATGTTGSMPKINQGVVCNTPIMMTTTNRQKNIIDKIESKLSLIESAEKNITTSLQQAEAMRQSILKRAFEGKL